MKFVKKILLSVALLSIPYIVNAREFFYDHLQPKTEFRINGNRQDLKALDLAGNYNYGGFGLSINSKDIQNFKKNYLNNVKPELGAYLKAGKLDDNNNFAYLNGTMKRTRLTNPDKTKSIIDNIFDTQLAEYFSKIYGTEINGFYTFTNSDVATDSGDIEYLTNSKNKNVGGKICPKLANFKLILAQETATNKESIDIIPKLTSPVYVKNENSTILDKKGVSFDNAAFLLQLVNFEIKNRTNSFSKDENGIYQLNYDKTNKAQINNIFFQLKNDDLSLGLETIITKSMDKTNYNFMMPVVFDYDLENMGGFFPFYNNTTNQHGANLVLYAGVKDHKKLAKRVIRDQRESFLLNLENNVRTVDRGIEKSKDDYFKEKGKLFNNLTLSKSEVVFDYSKTDQDFSFTTTLRHHPKCFSYAVDYNKTKADWTATASIGKKFKNFYFVTTAEKGKNKAAEYYGEIGVRF